MSNDEICRFPESKERTDMSILDINSALVPLTSPVLEIDDPDGYAVMYRLYVDHNNINI